MNTNSVILLSVTTLMMDQMSTLKQSSPLWLESFCMCMETWMMMASMKVRTKTRLMKLQAKIRHHYLASKALACPQRTDFLKKCYSSGIEEKVAFVSSQIYACEASCVAVAENDYQTQQKCVSSRINCLTMRQNAKKCVPVCSILQDCIWLLILPTILQYRYCTCAVWVYVELLYMHNELLNKLSMMYSSKSLYSK